VLDCIILLCKLSIYPHYLALSNWYNTTGLSWSQSTKHSQRSAMYQSVCWPLTCDLGGLGLFPNQSMSFFFVGKVTVGQDSFPVLQFFPCHYNSTHAPYSSIHLSPTLYKLIKWRNLKQNPEINFKMLCRTFIYVPEFADVSVHTMKVYRGNWVMAPPILKLRNRSKLGWECTTTK